MHKWVMFVLFIGAAVLGLGSLFDQVTTHAKANAPDTSGVKKLNLVATNFKFDQPNYTVTAGEKMKVVLTLNEGIHEVEIKDFGIKLDKANPTAEVTFDKPGTYEIHCILPCGQGHDNMKATLTVQ